MGWESGEEGIRVLKEKRKPRSWNSRRLRALRCPVPFVPIIYDGTVTFCDRFLDKRTRTVHQMVQAARSGRQNIAERQRQQQRPPAPGSVSPTCPLCGKPMALRTASKGAQSGSQF